MDEDALLEREASVLRQDARLEAEDAEEEATLGRLRRLRMGQRLVQLRRAKLVRVSGAPRHLRWARWVCWARMIPGKGRRGRLCLGAFSPNSPFRASVGTCEYGGLHAGCSEGLSHAWLYICIQWICMGAEEPAAVRQAALRAGQAGGAAGARALDGARVPAEARLAEERFVLRDFIVAERWRGIGWLLTVTVFVCWVSGVMDRDNALMP